jgi:hypothetical protein
LRFVIHGHKGKELGFAAGALLCVAQEKPSFKPPHVAAPKVRAAVDGQGFSHRLLAHISTSWAGSFHR